MFVIVIASFLFKIALKIFDFLKKTFLLANIHINIIF